MMDPIAQSDRSQRRRRPLARLCQRESRLGDFEREADIVLRRQRRDEVEALEHDAECRAPERREFVLTEAGEILSGNDHLARTRSLKPRQQHQQGGFAAAGRTDDRDHLPGKTSNETSRRM